MILIQGTLLSRNYFSGSYSNSVAQISDVSHCTYARYLSCFIFLFCRVPLHGRLNASNFHRVPVLWGQHGPLLGIPVRHDLRISSKNVPSPYSQRLHSDHSPFSAISKTLTTREAVVLRHSNWQGYGTINYILLGIISNLCSIRKLY